MRQIPRFGLSSRRFVGRADHALVLVTRDGSYDTFLPPHRPGSVRRYAALYEVNTDPHTYRLRTPLPSTEDSFEFEVTTDISWRVTDPEAFVRSQERDVPGLLTRRLLPLMRSTSRGYGITASAAAEEAVQRALDEAEPAGRAEGLHIGCTVRLRGDAEERFHQQRLRAARHAEEAADPEHAAARLTERYATERSADRIAFYERQLTRGGTSALALHLAVHPDQTSVVLGRLRDDHAELVRAQLDLIKHVLGSDGLEDHQLDEPHQRIADRMVAILRADGPTADGPALPHTDPLAKPHPGRPLPESGT